MSSGKLDQSLDEILSTQRRAGSGSHRRSTRRAAVATRSVPTGGIQKTKAMPRGSGKPVAQKAHGMSGMSKIMVSGMPKDVSETQIKEYFNSSVGGVKKVEISYGPGGVSRGQAHVLFHTADGAKKAYSKLNGLLIDGRPVKVEVIVSQAELIPTPTPLVQRFTNPKEKAKPKPVSAARGVNGAKDNIPASRAAAKKQRRTKTRPAKKTAEQLDEDMKDYFEGLNNASDHGNTAAAANGDATMEDEIL